MPALELPAMVPVPPAAPPQAPHSAGVVVSQATSQASASATLAPPPLTLPARLAKLLMKSWAPWTMALENR